MTITPGRYDITLYQGATFATTLTWKDSSDSVKDLTGYTARMQARHVVDAVSPFINLTTENGGITLGGTQGTVSLLMSAAQTSAITHHAGVYDLELMDADGVVCRLLQGNVLINREVTR